MEMAGEASRIFMGVQIQCAQCHDHKTDAWKRRQFHEFAAFFAGTKQNQAVKASPGEQAVFEIVVAGGQRRYTMPELDNPQKQIPIAPKFFLASSKAGATPALPEGLAVKERRALAASYITGQDNPWFAKAYINRVWYVLMGEAFYEPIDDIGPERTAQGARGARAAGHAMAEGGIRHPVAVPDDSQHGRLSAPGALNVQRGRQNAVCFELREPVSCRSGV